MKKIFSIAIIALLFIAFSSCERDESLDPRPVLVQGAYARLDITKPRINIDDPTSEFGGMLTSPSGKISKYNLYVRRTDKFGRSFGEFKLIRSITSFPVDLKFTIADIATALEVPVTDLEFGDVYRFYSEVYDLSNNRTDFYNLSTTIQSNQAFYKQAYRFQTDLTNTAGLLDEFDSYGPQ